MLDGLASVSICTGYACADGKVLHEFPADLTRLAGCTPIYEELPGWTSPTRGVQQFDQLPTEARAYIARLESVTGVPAAIVSTGSDREETILRKDVLDW